LENRQAVGYSNLGTRIENMLRGAETSQMNDLADAYAMESGRLAQNMVSSGLGNSTVQGSMQRGLLARLSKEQTRVANEFAGTRAGYQSDIGQAGLGAARQVGLSGLDASRMVGQQGLQYQGQRQSEMLAQRNRAIGAASDIRQAGLGHQAASVAQG